MNPRRQVVACFGFADSWTPVARTTGCWWVGAFAGAVEALRTATEPSRGRPRRLSDHQVNRCLQALAVRADLVFVALRAAAGRLRCGSARHLAAWPDIVCPDVAASIRVPAVTKLACLSRRHVDYKHSRIKQYHKEGRALRTETVINDTYDFDVGRRLSNLDDLKQIGFAANRRLLGVQRLSHD